MADTEYSTLLQFIISRDPDIVIDLLKDAAACRTFIRLLLPLSQHFLFRLLMIPGPIPVRMIQEWANESTRDLNEAYLQLKDSHFFVFSDMPDETNGIELHPDIKRVLLYGDANSSTNFDGTENSQHSDFPFDTKSKSIFPQKQVGKLTNLDEIPPIDPDILDAYSSQQLDIILSWMLKLSDEIEPEIRQLLADSKLINFDNELTQKGHQFVLADRRSQIWSIVQSYLDSFKDSPSELIEALRFVLKLGSLQFTKGYPISSLTDTQRELMHSFCSLGLIYIDAHSYTDYFFPTRIVLNFFGKEQLAQSEGWILIDTNFKITAYTSSSTQSQIQVALLKKFTIITYQMPGFTSAFISPQSFKDALDQGTTLDDILRFLETNVCRTKGSGTIPYEVRHQLQVWKEQRDRIKTEPDCMMRVFQFSGDADAAQAIAEDLHGFVARINSKDNNYTIITREQIEPEFMQRLKEYKASKFNQPDNMYY